MSTVIFDNELHKFDNILIKIKNVEEKLLTHGFDQKDFCLFISVDIKDYLVRIFNKYVEKPEIKNPNHSFMGYRIRSTKGKNEIHLGIICN